MVLAVPWEWQNTFFARFLQDLARKCIIILAYSCKILANNRFARFLQIMDILQDSCKYPEETCYRVPENAQTLEKTLFSKLNITKDLN